jgi:hypothetical protein
MGRGVTMPAPRALPAWAQQAVAAYLASGGKVTVCRPCLARYRPAPPCPAYLVPAYR